jgi:hypothetical protein
VTSSSHAWRGPRYLPYAFTEQGVSMLSSVLVAEDEGRSMRPKRRIGFIS